MMVLGVDTDSQDSTGICDGYATGAIARRNRAQALEAEFTGDLWQVPPMFSALKKDGVRLYRLARQGKEVPREPRTIRIEAAPIAQLTNDGDRNSRSPVRAALMFGLWRRTWGLARLWRTFEEPSAHRPAVSLDDRSSVDPGRRWRDAMRQCAAPLLSLGEALVHLRAVTWRSRLLSRLRLGQQEILGADRAGSTGRKTGSHCSSPRGGSGRLWSSGPKISPAAAGGFNGYSRNSAEFDFAARNRLR